MITLLTFDGNIIGWIDCNFGEVRHADATAPGVQGGQARRMPSALEEQ